MKPPKLVRRLTAFSLLAPVLVAAFLLSAAAPNTPTPTPVPPPPPTVRPYVSASPVATATATMAPVVPIAPQLAQDPPELRAVWVDAYHDGFKTAAQVDDLVNWARQANVNALFVEVRRRGDAFYNQSIEPRTEDPYLTPGFDALQYLIQRAHQGPQRIQVHAWLATLPIWDRNDAAPIAPNHVFNLHGPDNGDGTTWLMLKDDGTAWAGSDTGGMYYLDPGNPAAARYTADVYLNVVKNYDVDGVHLDQVRYYEGAAGHWGYNPTSVARFDKHYGRDPGSQPDWNDPDWMQWRRDQVTALVRRIYLETKAIKPNVAVTAAVVAWGAGPSGPTGWQKTAPYSAVFQDWRTWLQEGIVDYLMPMDYYRENDPQAGWFDNWSAWQAANRGKRDVAIGVGNYLNSADANQAQISRARSLSPLGVSLYSYAVPQDGAESDFSGSHAASLGWLQSLFARPAPVPDLPWLNHPVNGNVLIDLAGREGASVTLAGPTSFQWRSDGTGLAGGPEIPPGTYTLTIQQAPGVDPTPKPLVVQAGKATVLRFPPAS